MKKANKKSRLADDVENICYLCGCYGDMHEHHIFGGSVRQTCDKHRLVVHLCPTCHRKLHDHNVGEQFLHEIGQKVYEEEIGTREQFIQDYIRSYL